MPSANPYDLDPEVRAVLKIETFQGKFTTRDFVENTSKNLLKHANPKAFDPKPFIRTFERSIDELLKLRETVTEQSKDLEASVQLTEAGHRKKLHELKVTFEDVVHSFETLETRINEVGNIAIRIGEQLETIDRQRLRASESKDLIEYFMAFNRGDIARLENQRARGKDGQFKAAIIARRLNAIAKEVDIPGAEAARARIEKYCEVLEKELLEQFDRAYRRKDVTTMKGCAKTLQEFNGCESCIKLYVNQHEFFISKVNLGQSIEFLSSTSWNDLPNPQVPPPPVDQGLINLYEEIRTTVKQEAEVINAVFPNPIGVMQVFLQRIFAQLIQTYLESLLTHAENNSTLAYLRSLAAVHVATKELAEDLKSLDIRQKGLSDHNLFEPSEEGSRGNNTIAEVLEQCIEDLFVPYTEGDRYIEKEKKSLGELYSSLLLRFTAYHAPRATSLIQRAVNQITTSSQTLLDIPTTEEDGNLSINVSMLILKIHAESIRRSVQLSPPSELYPCNACVDCLKKVQTNVSQLLDGKNFEHFLSEIGIAFYGMLLEHFKKFAVSAAGDIAKYQETIALFKIPQLDERFEMLRQLGNLFIVKPEILKSVLNEGYLAKLDIKYILPYLQARTDFRSAGIDTLLGATTETGTGERNFNEKARARLAAMGLNLGPTSGRKWMTLTEW
ncbi:10562_t:CDS:10 [Acaulospora colombiana]|uniref:10562_t:CDS:1 n=1 Tax=Acaulospora colombiana TaxID=27376 RepID=A0ACA9K1T8_9GLOM|nr:10562_t:CDS:10 [Acaulospora colombiana]